MSEEKRRFRIVLQRFHETYTPRHYGRVIKSPGFKPRKPGQLRHLDLNKNVEGAFHYERATVGTFKVFDSSEGNREVFSCFCIENEGPDSSKEGSDLRLPAGEYNIVWYNSTVWLPTPPKDAFKLAPPGLFTPLTGREKPSTRGLGVVGSDKNLKLDARGFSPSVHARGRSGVAIHLGRDPTGSEGCLLLTDKLDLVPEKDKDKTPDKWTGGNNKWTKEDMSATFKAVIRFYSLVDRWGPHNFVLIIVNPDSPPPLPYETERVESGDFSDSDDGDDAFDPMNVPSYNRMEHRMNTKNGYYDLKIDFSTTI